MSMSITLKLVACFAVATVAAATTQPVQANKLKLRGSKGTLSGFSHSGARGSAAGIGGTAYGRGAAGAIGGRFTGRNGGTLSAAGAGFVSPNAAFKAGGYSGTGPQGGTAAGGSVAGWKRGYGGFSARQTNVQGPAGSTYSSSSLGKYNAQTGQGTYNASKSGTNAQTGQSYGYTNDTSYTKGQGGTTTIDTMNNGDYTVDWAKGTKPVVTSSP